MIRGPCCQFARVPTLFTSLSNGYTALCITQESATLSRRKLGVDNVNKAIAVTMKGIQTRIPRYGFITVKNTGSYKTERNPVNCSRTWSQSQEILSAAPRFCLRNGSFGFLQQSDEIRKSWFCRLTIVRSWENQ